MSVVATTEKWLVKFRGLPVAFGDLTEARVVWSYAPRIEDATVFDTEMQALSAMVDYKLPPCSSEAHRF